MNKHTLAALVMAAGIPMPRISGKRPPRNYPKDECSHKVRKILRKVRDELAAGPQESTFAYSLISGVANDGVFADVLDYLDAKAGEDFLDFENRSTPEEVIAFLTRLIERKP
jgi:hypothetical protein